VTRFKKILLAVGLVGVAIGGFALTKYLTRNVKRIVGGFVIKQTYDEPAEPFYE